MKKVINSKPFIVIIAFLATLAPILNYAFRFGYVFVNAVTFNGLNEILLGVMIVNAIFMLIYAYLKVRAFKDSNSVFYYISVFLSVLFILADCIYAIMSPNDIKTMGAFLLDMLGFLGVLFGLLFLLFVYPHLKHNIKKPVAAVLIVTVIACFAIPAFSLYPFKLASEPLVLDNGEEYVVIWATNTPSTGYLKYSYEGEEYTVYHENAGRMATGLLHNITLPYEHLNNNSYSVHSTRVIQEISYGGWLGKTISSKEYNFRGDIPEGANIWAFSDWHCEVNAAAKAASYLDKPDLVLLVGDYADGYNHISDVIKYIVAGGAKVTKSECPAIFAMGNHDTRGNAVAHLGYILGLDKFYYQVNKGDISFLVLDSGEDKPDNHPEYGGLAAFDQFHKGQLDWLQSLSPFETKYVIALSHDAEISYKEELSEQYYDEVSRLNVQLIISGHVHKSEFLEEEYPLPVLLDGGKNGVKLRGNLSYTATQITINDNVANIKAVNDKGRVQLEKEFYFE